MRIWALMTDALREIYARKVIIGIVIIEVVALAITALILFSEGMQNGYRDSRLAGTADVEQYSVDSDGDELMDRRHEDSLLREFDSAIPTDTLRSRDTQVTPTAADTTAVADTSRSKALRDVQPRTSG